MDSLHRLIAWYLNTSDPGAAADYLEELVDETTDDNYEAIIEQMLITPGYSSLSLLFYLEEIASPDRPGILTYLDDLADKGAGSSYGSLIAALRRQVLSGAERSGSDPRTEV
jgi:hypothetical protein